MKRNKLCIVTGMITMMTLLAWESDAYSAIVSGSVDDGTAKTAGGVFQNYNSFLGGSPVPTIGNNQTQSNNLRAFDELQDITLAADLTLEDGTIIGQGTRVASHYIFFDPSSTKNIQGTVSFSTEIIGIAKTDHDVKDLTSFLALDSSMVNYLYTTNVGLESGQDNAYIDASDKTKLHVNMFKASSPGDYIRVLTYSPAAVPEPSSMLLTLCACAGPAWMAKRRRDKTAKAAANTTAV